MLTQNMEIPSEIQNLLEDMYRLSKKEDWDESFAQGIIEEGSILYQRYILDRPF